MCGRYGRDIPWPALHAALNLVRPEASYAPNLEPEWDIRPTTPQWIARQGDDGVELIKARWWLIPFWHRGGLKDFKLTTFNAKSETVATSRTFRDAFQRRRCLIPASCWYEWTGPKGSKEKWRFTPRDEPWLCFAGVWDRCTTTDAGEIESFTIITQPAGAPLNGYHDRAPVVIPPTHWEAWLRGSSDVGSLLGPESPDAFKVERC
jgi:putative SOS response-associated peptidase YedK